MTPLAALTVADPVDAEIGDEALQLEAVNRFVLAQPFGSYRQIS